MATFYIGQIFLFGGNFAPRGWMFCSGQLLSITQNTALFSILGTTYGGDGRTTFALPDLRGRVLMSAGRAPSGTTYDLGQVANVESVSLTIQNLPAHTHDVTAATATLNASAARPELPSPNGSVPAQDPDVVHYAKASDGNTLNAAAVVPTVTVGVSGGSQPVGTMMPYLTLNYCICTQGLFPSRN